MRVFHLFKLILKHVMIIIYFNIKYTCCKIFNIIDIVDTIFLQLSYSHFNFLMKIQFPSRGLVSIDTIFSPDSFQL